MHQVCSTLVLHTGAACYGDIYPNNASGFLPSGYNLVKCIRNCATVCAFLYKCLDLQVLFDPLEEKLDLPALMINVADGFSGRMVDVYEENVVFPGIRVPVAHSPQMYRAFFGFGSGKDDHLIGSGSPGAVNFMAFYKFGMNFEDVPCCVRSSRKIDVNLT